jgi:hypothetical protein
VHHATAKVAVLRVVHQRVELLVRNTQQQLVIASLDVDLGILLQVFVNDGSR